MAVYTVYFTPSLCHFHDANDNVFSSELLSKCMVDDPPQPFPSFVKSGFLQDGTLYLETLLAVPYFYLGIDIGHVSDYTAIAVLEKLETYIGLDKVHYNPAYKTTYTLRHIERFPRGTTYTAIVNHFKSITQTPLLKSKCTFVVDATGAGRPIFDMIRNKVQYCSKHSITITSGSSASHSNDTNNVPKATLITCLQLAIESGNLRIPKSLTHLNLLLNELTNFKAKLRPSGYTTMQAAHGEHDDLLMAVALAVYHGMKF